MPEGADHDLLIRLDQKLNDLLMAWSSFVNGPGAPRCVAQEASCSSAHKRITELRNMVWVGFTAIIGIAAKIVWDWLENKRG